jgi:hypothetical protein
MSVIRPENHPNSDDPDDPLYYAPQRSVRSEANPRSSSVQHRSEDRFPPTATYRSRFDEMREEALAKTMPHPLESKFIHERRQPRLLIAVAGMAAGIGVSVIAALVFFGLVPKLQKSAPSELVVIAPASAKPAQTTQTTPEQSQALLQKFLQWKQNQ